MTQARAPRQQRGRQRREELCAAAARLAGRDGPSACTARAVATEAGLPLAAVSYYFPDLSVLLGEAIRRVGDDWRAHARRVVAAATDAGPVDTPERLATVLALAVLPPAGEPDPSPHPEVLPGRAAVTARYRHLLAAADSAAAAEMADLRVDLVDILETLLVASRAAGPSADLLLCVADGAAVGAVAEGDPDPARRVVAALTAALDHRS